MSIFPDDAPDRKASQQSTNPVADAASQMKDFFADYPGVPPQNEIVRRVTQAYLDAIDPDDPPSPEAVEKQLLKMVNGVIKSINARLRTTEEKQEKLSLPRALQPVQVALIIHHLYRVAEVTPGGTEQDDGLGVLSIYQDSGEFEGLYRRVDLGILEGLARDYNFSHDEKWFKELERSLHGIAPKVAETTDPDLVVTPNLIFNYRTGERIPFSPDYVFLARNTDVDLIDQQHPVPEVLDDDGNVVWNYEDWWAETVPSKGTRNYLWHVIGAALRPGHDWQVMPSLYSESGSNGKGTILVHVRAIVGSRNCASVPIKAYSSQFGKQQLLGKRLNAPDETEVGSFIKDASDLKSIITNDPITIDRKHLAPITYKPRMLTILTLNGPLNFRDKTQSMDRRLAIVPMTQRFTGTTKNKAIKDDYLLRREVCEYMLYKVLVELPRYWELNEPAEVKQALHAHKRDTNTVLAYIEEYKDQFERPFVPFPMVHAHYKAWLKENREGSGPVEAGQFTKEVKQVLNPDVWIVPQAADGSDLKLSARSWLTAREPVLDEYFFIDAVDRWQYEDNGYGAPRGLAKSAPRQVRGFMRRDVYEAWMAAGGQSGRDAAADAISRAKQRRTQARIVQAAPAQHTDDQKEN